MTIALTRAHAFISQYINILIWPPLFCQSAADRYTNTHYFVHLETNAKNLPLYFLSPSICLENNHPAVSLIKESKICGLHIACGVIKTKQEVQCAISKTEFR